jgi:DNA-binding PadR family transcriptional regulator
MAQVDHLGELEALVLTAVVRVGANANGAAVYREIQNRAGRDPSLPAVHVTLRRLEEKGLLTSEAGTTSPRGGRPRRFYRSTRDGVRALQTFQDMWRNVWRGLQWPDSEVEP